MKQGYQPPESGEKPALPTTGNAVRPNVVIHPVTAKKVAQDLCPKCGGELDTGWECNDCGFDAIGFVDRG